MENIFIIYGKALKNARMGVKGLTQSDVAKALGIQRTTYVNWESKETIEIDGQTYKTLIKSLGVSDHVLTKSPHEAVQSTDILEHPVIKSLVRQSEYIMERVRELESENRALKSQQKN